MRGGLSIILIVLSIFCANAQKKYRLPDGVSQNQIDPHWIMVKTKPNADAFTDTFRNVQSLKTKKKDSPSVLDGLKRVQIKKGEDPIALINRLLTNPGVIYAEPILEYQILYSPSDPENIFNQNYLNQISAYDAWTITRGDDDITIGIVDTGLDLDHEDLITSIWTNEADPIDGIDNDNNGYIDDFYGYDFADGDSDPSSNGSAHGVRVGGIAGAATDNQVGISGVGFNTKIAALKGFRTVGTTSNNLFEAIIYAADNGIQILNLSFGSLRDGLQSEQDIIDYAVLEKNVVITAAAGNTDVDGKFYPASYNHVLSVGATDGSDNRWSLSTYNYAVDIMAPGTSIYSTINDNAYGSDFGTSYAAPMVAGAAALVKSVFPDLNAKQIMERIRVSADDIYGVGNNSMFLGKLGQGRLNVYNAVAQENLKSIRSNEFSIATSRGADIFFGDTVTVSIGLTNYLDKVNDPSITISAPDNNFTLFSNTFSTGTMASLVKDSITFDIILNEDLPPSSKIALQLDYADGSYTDFEFLEFTTQPDYFEFGSNLKMTISGNGNLGYEDPLFTNGIGIQFNETSTLTFGGLLLAESETTVSDNIVENFASATRQQDFVTIEFYRNIYHPAADHFGYSVFEDPSRDVLIEQSIYAWEETDYLILRYRIINNTPDPITNLKAGFYSDFDLTDANANQANYSLAKNYLSIFDKAESLFMGTKTLGDGTPLYSCINIGGFNGHVADVNEELTDISKYNFLVNQPIANAGELTGGNDVAGFNGLALNQIDAFDSQFFTVIIAGSSSAVDLEATFSEAENKLSEVIEQPRILETIFSCEGSQVTLDPSSGNSFQFFEDAAGLNMLHEGVDFLTGTINTDTTFYIRNIDEPYPSDLFQYQVKLIEEVADFEINPDTLYLDHSTNIVSFLDQSFEAISWSWNFGEGTTSSIQNPSLSFNSAGVYGISLSIENETGCVDTKLKSLVVAERPSFPSFTFDPICPGETITLNDPSADKLLVFESENSMTPAYEGSNLQIGPFESTETVFVQGIYNQLKSQRVQVEIPVQSIQKDIDIQIDTLSEAHQIQIEAITSETSISWAVNAVGGGTDKIITVGSSEPTVDLELNVTNSSGCIVTEYASFKFSSSPIPSQSDIEVCLGSLTTIKPQNGTIFGFYLDEGLTELIKKGKELRVIENMKVFIVGLDDGLPSIPREVNVTFQEFDASILYETSNLSEENQVDLSVQSEATITSYKWYIDGNLSTTVTTPKLFLENRLYEIVLEVVNDIGCTQRDTLALDLSPTLSTPEVDKTSIYPNPSDGLINITSNEQITGISIWDLSGKQCLLTSKSTYQLDLGSFLSAGAYIVRLNTINDTYEHKIILTPRR